MTGASITGCGVALPDRELSNAELADSLPVSEDWILDRTGIRSRRVAGADDSTSSLAARAGSMAIRQAGLEPDQLDLVIVATITPDYQFPATACLVQAQLGCTHAGAFDLNAGCSGFLYALAQAQALVASGSLRRVLVCGADTLTRIADYSDPSSCILFGDGAGAVVVEGNEQPDGLASFVLCSDGSEPGLLWLDPGTRMIGMQGREVYRRAVDGMATSVLAVLAKADLALADVDLVVAHQANARILNAVASRLGIPPGKLPINIDAVGNTSAASIPLVLAEAADDGRLGAGDVVLLAAFGAGFAWGAGLIRWGITAPTRAVPPLVGRTARLESV